MPITVDQLVQILPRSRSVARQWVPALNLAMQRYAITSPVRIAAFLAQVGHESDHLNRVVENLNYSAQGLAGTWPSRFAVDPKARPLVPNARALQLARRPEAIANAAYGGRMGNGPEASGDGWRFRGRGPLQVTGRAQYAAIGAALGLPLEARPELLEQPEPGALAAALFWWWNGLNQLADANRFEELTARINAGKLGLAARIALRQRAAEVLVLA